MVNEEKALTEISQICSFCS